MKVILSIVALATTFPAFSQTAPHKADSPVVYDRNSRQVLPYDKRPASCPRSDLTPPNCISAEKPESEQALKPKRIG
jgi:hypothetical protein